MEKLAALLLCAALAGCVTLTEQPRAVVMRAGKLDVQSLGCDAAGAAAASAADGDALDANAIRIVSWNIHKQGDDGWQSDLRRFVSSAEVVLLQEATIDDELRRIVEDAGFDWVLASPFSMAVTTSAC